MKNLIVLLLLSVSIGANAGIYNLEMPAKKPGIFGVKDNTPPSTFDLKPDLTKCQVRYDKIKEQQLALVIERQELRAAGSELNQPALKANEELLSKTRLDMIVFDAECRSK